MNTGACCADIWSRGDEAGGGDKQAYSAFAADENTLLAPAGRMRRVEFSL
jgi:hypothetical protein